MTFFQMLATYHYPAEGATKNVAWDARWAGICALTVRERSRVSYSIHFGGSEVATTY
jgi:hypothetical protein